MATTLEEVHAEAFEERSRAAFMDDPTIATPGTVEDAQEHLLEQVVPFGGPAVTKPETGTDLVHNPYATVVTRGEGGEDVEPQGELDDADKVRENLRNVGLSEDLADGLDTQYDPVNTTNDISIIDSEDRDEDFDPADAEDADEDDGPPAKSAAKPAWVNYAKRQGLSKAEAEELTKDELVERFG